VQLLCADLLPEAWIAPPEVRQLRAMLRHRAQLVRLRTLLRNRVHAVLADHGHGRPAGCWSGPGRAWLAALELPAVSREAVDDALALMDALQQPIDRLDAEVRQRAKANPRVMEILKDPQSGRRGDLRAWATTCARQGPCASRWNCCARPGMPVSASQAAACSMASGRSPTAAEILSALSASSPGTCRITCAVFSCRVNTFSSTGRAIRGCGR
jgi:hypothetical protein